jgi:hypothetical protein
MSLRSANDSSCLTNSKAGAGISTCYPSAMAFALALGPANPGMMDIAQETLGFRCQGLSP